MIPIIHKKVLRNNKYNVEYFQKTKEVKEFKKK